MRTAKSRFSGEPIRSGERNLTNSGWESIMKTRIKEKMNSLALEIDIWELVTGLFLVILAIKQKSNNM